MDCAPTTCTTRGLESFRHIGLGETIYLTFFDKYINPITFLLAPTTAFSKFYLVNFLGSAHCQFVENLKFKQEN